MELLLTLNAPRSLFWMNRFQTVELEDMVQQGGEQTQQS